ncbi:AraC family transcriptional regulator [Flavobacteriaceae bacterium]|jgi:AraC-like DNA-binding protein|nr:AraC family transcriptional regulator [Flavobacteriaceae bacterium]
MSLYLLLNIKLPIVLVASGRTFAFIFFFLFIKSFLEKNKARLTFIYFIPSLLLILVDSINTSGIRLFNFINNQISSENILGFNTYDFVGKEDLFVVLCLNTLFFTCIIFNKFFQILKSGILNSKTKDVISSFFKYYYILITTTSISTLFVLGLFLFNYKFIFLTASVKILGILTILILVVRPEIIRKISRINNSNEKDEGLLKLYHQIKSLFSEDNQYLKHNYTSASISAQTGIRNELVRNCIKKHSDMSVPQFINSYRIKFATKLIDEGYLQNYSMEGLAENSGFSSQENFNRVFKLIKLCTPTQYLNSSLKN